MISWALGNPIAKLSFQPQDAARGRVTATRAKGVTVADAFEHGIRQWPRAAALARLRCATVGLCVTQRPEGGEPMGWIRKHRPSPATGIALAALIVALGGVAFAAIPDSNGTIHGCFQ